MAALTTDRKIEIRAGGTTRTMIAKLAAATTIYKGALVAKNASGYVVPASDALGLAVIGFAAETVVNAGAAGAAEITIITGVVAKLNSLVADPVVQADMHAIVRVADDNTVRNAGGVADIIAGICEGIDTDGVWVYVDAATNIALAT